MSFTEAQYAKVRVLIESLQHRYPALQHDLPLARDTKQRLPTLAAEFGVANPLITKSLSLLTRRIAALTAAGVSLRETLAQAGREAVT